MTKIKKTIGENYLLKRFFFPLFNSFGDIILSDEKLSAPGSYMLHSFSTRLKPERTS